MADDAPVRLREVVQLQSLGVNAAAIGFNTLTLESERFVCVREKAGDAATVAVVDLADAGHAVLRRPISAESAIMHPDANVIALRSGRQLQVFDLGRKTKLRGHVMGEDVAYWRWLGPATLGIVCERGVYHWSVDVTAEEADGSEAPKRVFERHESLAGCQIISYKTDATGRWMVVVGIVAQMGKVAGRMQLHNTDRGVSQTIDGHAGAFAEIRLEGARHPTHLFAFSVRPPAGGPGKLHVVEIDHRDGAPVYAKRALEIAFPAEAESDFPVAMVPSAKWGVLYVVTKFGFLHVFDAHTGTAIYANRVSSETVFAATEWRGQGGLLAVNRKGQVLGVAIDESKIVPHVLGAVGAPDVAVRLALAAGPDVPGADELFVSRFAQLVQAGAYAEAARLAARSPRGVLRTPETIATLGAVAVSPGAVSPLLEYFTVLLEADGAVLTADESLAIVTPVLAQGKAALVEKWLAEDRLTCTAALGDAAAAAGEKALALSIYVRAEAHDAACATLVSLRQFSKVRVYVAKTGHVPDYGALLEAAMDDDPGAAVEFGKALLAAGDGGAAVEPERVFDLFAARGLPQQAAAAVLDTLRTNAPETGALQTKVLRMALQQAPAVADALFKARALTQYDRAEVGALCEAAGLWQRALEHVSVADEDAAAEAMARIIRGARDADATWIASHWSRRDSGVSPGAVVGTLEKLLGEPAGSVVPGSEAERFLPLALAVGTRAPDRALLPGLLALLEAHGAHAAVLAVTSGVLAGSQDAAVHMAHLRAAVLSGDAREAERHCKASAYLDAAAAWAFLAAQPADVLPDPLPLLVVADRFGLTAPLVRLLLERGHVQHLELYATRVNPSRLPEVVAAILDCRDDAGCADLPGLAHFDDGRIQAMIAGAPPRYGLGALVSALEGRGRIDVLLPVLEARVRGDAGRDAAAHTALAKVHVVRARTLRTPEARQAAAAYLRDDGQYDAADVGRFCAGLGISDAEDAAVALVAMERGRLDAEVVRLTSETGLFAAQARYVLGRRDATLWASLLANENAGRSALVAALVDGSALEAGAGRALSAEDVSVAVRALVAADMGRELVALLERLLYGGGPFAGNRSLQNLLLLTAIRCAPESVMGHIGRLDRFDAGEIGRACAAAGLRDEAVAAHRRTGTSSGNAEALGVLLDAPDGCASALAYAEECNDRVVWGRLGRGLLDAAENALRAGDADEADRLLGRALDALVRAEDASDAPSVIGRVARLLDGTLPRVASAGAASAGSASPSLLSAGAMARSGSVGMLVSGGSTGTIVPSGSTGTMVPSGPAGTMAPSGSANAMVPSGSANAMVSAGSVGTMIRSGSAGTMVPSGSAGSVGSSAVETCPRLKASTETLEALLAYVHSARAARPRDPLADGELLVTLARLHRLGDAEAVLAKPHGAQLHVVGERCYALGLYEAARLFFTAVGAWARLAAVHVGLGDLRAASEAARRAGGTRVLRDVHAAALAARDLDLAQAVGLQLLAHADAVDAVVAAYEGADMASDGIALLQAAVGGAAPDRICAGVYDALALMLARHTDESAGVESDEPAAPLVDGVASADASADPLVRFVSTHASRLNASRVSSALAAEHRWAALAALHVASGDGERALGVVLAHPAQAWSHGRVCAALQGLRPGASLAPETAVRLLRLYVEEVGPLRVPDLLQTIGGRVEPTRIVAYLRDAGVLSLGRAYLQGIQPGAQAGAGASVVNAALNELLLAEEDVAGLRASLARSDRLDASALAKRLAEHELPAVQLLAVRLFRAARQHRDALDVLLRLGRWCDAIALAAAPDVRDRALSEALVRRLADERRLTLFLAAAAACADTLPHDVVLECAWLQDWDAAAVPFAVQHMRDATRVPSFAAH